MNWKLNLGWRLLKGSAEKWNSSFVTALLGISIGVASLVVAMAVISGFEATLRSAVIDTTGEVIVMDRSRNLDSWQKLSSRVKEISPDVQDASPFLLLEAVATNQGNIAGVALQGVDPKTVDQVLPIRSRLIRGELKFEKSDQVYPASIGRGLAKNLKLEVGDQFRVVFPQPDPFDSERMQRKLLTLEVTGVLGLGKFEYDERQILTHIEALQGLMENSSAYSGLILKLEDSDQAVDTAQLLLTELGHGFWVRSWRDVEQSLFEAASYEKTIIFFVLFIIVVAAAVNVSTAININIIKRYSDIAVLKSLGLSSREVWQLLSLQGVVIGAMGVVSGYALGWLICWFLEWVQGRWLILPQEVYNIDKIFVVYQWQDAVAIIVATMLICYLSAAMPARRGARLKPVEGLRYE